MEENKEFKMIVKKHLLHAINGINICKKEYRKYKILIIHLLNGGILRYEYLFVKDDSISDLYETIIEDIKPKLEIIDKILESMKIHHEIEYINKETKYTLFFPVYFDLPAYTDHENIFLNHLYKEMERGDLEIECKNGKIKVHSLIIDVYGKETKSVMLTNMISSNFKKESKLLFDVSLVEELMDLLYLPHKWRFNKEKDYYPILSLLNFLMLPTFINDIFIHVFNNDPITASQMALEYYCLNPEIQGRLFVSGVESQEKVNKGIALEIMKGRHKPLLSPLVNLVKCDTRGFISRASFSINGYKCCLYYNYQPKNKLNSFVLYLKDHGRIWIDPFYFFHHLTKNGEGMDESFYCYNFKIKKETNESYPELPLNEVESVLGLTIKSFEGAIVYAKIYNDYGFANT